MAYSDKRQSFDPRAFTLTIGGTGLFLATMATMCAGILGEKLKDPPIKTINIPIEPIEIPPSQPIDPKPATEKTVNSAPITSINPIVNVGPTKGVDLPPPSNDMGMGGTGVTPFGNTTEAIDPPKPLPPVMIGAKRVSGVSFQPPYPDREIGLGRDGTVRVRVTIGTDGRVKSVTKLSATSDAFFESTRRHALSNWRFTPATKDGVAVESTQELSLRFSLDDM